MTSHKYNNEVQPNNKFGHTLELMERQLPSAVEGVHLDLACGFGNIAEFTRDRWGLEYVGVDVDGSGLQSLGERGFEGHTVDLVSEAVYDDLVGILRGRTLASVTFLDGLEHLVDGRFALAAIGRLIAEHRAVAFLSVPNVTHYDVAIKSLLGSWTYTEAGLLDRTHYQLYSASSLQHALRRAGLSPVDKFDVVLNRSDQHFPTDNALLSEATPVNLLLRSLREHVDSHGTTNQFVWAVAPVPATEPREVRDAGEPFLSIIMRTQGRRSQELREALLCLAGQSSPDFEVIIVAHKTTTEEQKAVEQVIADQPPSLRSRIRLLLLDRGRRSTPLNVGLREARGRYISIHDDDDIVLGDWVREFARAERMHSGRILRGVTLRQQVDVCNVQGMPGVRAVGAPLPEFTEEFSLTEHLVLNQSPPIGFVFPRSLVVDLGFEFDESMTTTEDWEFLLRAAPLVGVTDVNKVLAIYHWWSNRESSRTEHPDHEWAQNAAEINRRIDSRPMLLPAGETRSLREKLTRLDHVEHLYQHVHSAEGTVGRLQTELHERGLELQRVRKMLDRSRERNSKLRGRLNKLRRRVQRLRRQSEKHGDGVSRRKSARKSANARRPRADNSSGKTPAASKQVPRETPPARPAWRRAGGRVRRWLA